MRTEYIETVIVGGSQSGLAAGYGLTERERSFVIFDRNERIGDAWRNRWDSLRLFTSAPYSGLPGMEFPGSRDTYPTKDQVADYLEEYARRFELPVRTGVMVDRLSKRGDLFEVSTDQGSLSASNVVVAIGGYHRPRIPSFASDLDPSVLQLHSSQYRRPEQLRPGGVLVVGAGNSGSEIALDLAGTHRVWLSGREPGHEPTRAGTFPDRILMPIAWLLATKLTVDTKAGRKLRDRFLNPPRGIPLGRVRQRDFVIAGVERLGRTTGVESGRPVIDDGRRLEVANIIWSTGYVPDFGWIDIELPTENSYPLHRRGIVEEVPGLYFLGLQFLYSLSSALVGGVGRDALYIADHIARTPHRQPVHR
jgi:putative flavoprotein involved in K+ transport